MYQKLFYQIVFSRKNVKSNGDVVTPSDVFGRARYIDFLLANLFRELENV